VQSRYQGSGVSFWLGVYQALHPLAVPLFAAV